MLKRWSGESGGVQGERVEIHDTDLEVTERGQTARVKRARA